MMGEGVNDGRRSERDFRLIGWRFPNFFREILGECTSTMMFRGKFAMNVEEIDRTRNERFSNGASSAPLLNRGTVKIFLKIRCSKTLFIFGGRFFDAFWNGFKFQNSKVSRGLETVNQRKGILRKSGNEFTMV